MMQQRKKVLGRSLLPLFGAFLWVMCMQFASAQATLPENLGTDFLAGSHAKNMGMQCQSCHAGSDPASIKVDDSETVENQRCVACHGDLDKVAQKSKDLDVNPHHSHLGDINCTACHSGHTPSVSYCQNCHVFDDMKISHSEGAKPAVLKEALDKYNNVQPSRVEKTDVLIIGSGASGFTAALSAREKGLKVMIVEKMPIPGGNSQLAAGGMNAAGTVYQKEKGINDNAQMMYQDTMKGGKEINNSELVQILADQSAKSIDWLASKGMVLSNIGQGGGASAARMHGPSGGSFVGPYMSAAFRDLIAKENIDLRVNSKAVRLIKDDKGAVTGAIIKGKHSGVYQVDAKAVVLATGGFGANPDMVAKFRPELRETATSNQPGTQGDGVYMGEQAGAAMVDLKEIQLNPTMLVGSPVIVSEIVRGAGGIVVNRDGKRFISELTTRDATSAAILKEKGASAFLLFDQTVRDNVKQTGAFFELKKVLEADTVEGLAEKMGVDPATLKQTIERFNTFVEQGNDPDFNRPKFAQKFEKPMFYAIEIKPAIHYVMGGIKINAQAQVIDTDGQAIPGLYAAGEVTGGVHGANRLGGNSISETITFGRIAGDQAALWAQEH